MTRTYQIIPTNRKTLFLRNLESILLNHGLMLDNDTKKFRGNSSNEILELLNDFLSDEKNDTTDKSLGTYQLHSNFVRFMDERIRLSLKN